MQDIEALQDSMMVSIPEMSSWFSWATPEVAIENLQLHIEEAVM